MDKISIEMARAMMLSAQGLSKLPDHDVSNPVVLDTIRRMYLLQIDTIHVVARSPYLVLWSRLGDYRPEWLDELLAEGALFEYWSHAMCFIPIEDFGLYRRRTLDAIENRTWPYNWIPEWSDEHAEVLERVRTQMRENGAVRSADFENKDHKPGGWWNWKVEKDALEVMLLTGEAMVARRQNFQRIYDLRERVLPDWEDRGLPTTDELRITFYLRAVKALGVARPGWVPDYFRQPKKDIAKQLANLANDSLLYQVEIEGLKGPAYVHPENANLGSGAASLTPESGRTTLLSPFDPLVWDRTRALELFDFDYRIECYTPAAKRRYGYFTLPILHRNRIIGRLDPKAHRAEGVFEVKSIHLEPGVELDDSLVSELASALQELADWHRTPDLVIRQSNPPELAGMLAV
jgi:uncharacterized protein YcaQ